MKKPKKPAAPPSDPQPDPGPLYVDHRPGWVGGIRVVEKDVKDSKSKPKKK